MRNNRPTQPPPPAPADEPPPPAEIPETEESDRIVFLSWDAPLVPDRR